MDTWMADLQFRYYDSSLQVNITGTAGQPQTSCTGLKQSRLLSPKLFGLFADGSADTCQCLALLRALCLIEISRDTYSLKQSNAMPLTGSNNACIVLKFALFTRKIPRLCTTI